MARKIEAVSKSIFGFTSVEIYPSEYLGKGAYGAVCKAKCDQLPCAAKLLHSVLFQFDDPGTEAMMTKFQQECEFLGRIRHPCIVQYLGTVYDPESSRPILLMEIIDESLTKFLDRSHATLAYHVQVNLSYDIALALSYLHSNGIIHRDLSSNNVLIAAGSRAKVSDFGMLKLLERNSQATPLTKCPGTVAYMPPEALSDEPRYTEKLDCFSLGVLMIQIITRNFPDPTKAMITVHDPKYPTGRVLVPVPEMERRKKDVNLVEADHHLRPVALACIKDAERERLSADVICTQLSDLQSEEEYTNSLHGGGKAIDTENSALRMDLQSAREEIDQVKEINREKDIEISELRQQLHEFQTITNVGEINKLRRQLHELSTINKQRDAQIKDLRQELYKYETKSHNMPPVQVGREMTLKWDVKLKVSAKRAMWRGAATSVDMLAFFNPGLTGIVYVYDSTTNDWSELPRCLNCGFTLVTVNNFVTAVGGNRVLYTPGNALLSFSQGRWAEKYPPMLSKRSFPAAVCTARTLVVAGGCGEDCQALTTVEVMDTSTLQWSVTTSLPIGISSASMTACGDSIYLLGDDRNHVYSCSLKELHQYINACTKTAAKLSLQQLSVWKRNADLPVSRSTAVTLCGQVVSVGGYDESGEVDTVYCYDSATDCWVKVGQLLSAKGLPLATTLPGGKLTVVHGNHQGTLIGTATVTKV